jgi:photoactive yellow protein
MPLRDVARLPTRRRSPDRIGGSRLVGLPAAFKPRVLKRGLTITAQDRASGQQRPITVVHQSLPTTHAPTPADDKAPKQAKHVSPYVAFDDPAIQAVLDDLDSVQLDRLSFGVIRLDRGGRVTAYNTYESTLAGLPPERVIGRHFFGEVAPCMNNFMVSLRFSQEENLDAVLDYVLTLRMRPTKVRLRLLATSTSNHFYVLIDWA